MDHSVQRYINYYQHGGQLPVFRGMRDQYGAGLGSFFGRIARGVWDFLRPAVSAGTTSFIANTAQGLTEGKSIRDSARTGLSASVGSAIRGIGDESQRRIQGGSGRRRRRKQPARRAKRRRPHAAPKRRKHPRRKATRKRKRTAPKARPAKRRRVYKRHAPNPFM
ncbi:MAG: hypothetical protein FD144_5945, partial [Rhodospirillaceae bacterium]